MRTPTAKIDNLLLLLMGGDETAEGAKQGEEQQPTTAMASNEAQRLDLVRRKTQPPLDQKKRCQSTSSLSNHILFIAPHSNQ